MNNLSIAIIAIVAALALLGVQVLTVAVKLFRHYSKQKPLQVESQVTLLVRVVNLHEGLTLQSYGVPTNRRRE
jgi:Tfp pilus assembly major pilin PilA